MKPINILKELTREIVKPAKNLVEAEEVNDDNIMVYMNTWKNYNDNGADLDAYGIKDGWMTPEDAKEFADKYSEDEPFINDVDNCPFEVSDYTGVEILDDMIAYNELPNDEKEIAKAFIEDGSYKDFDEIVKKVQDGDYIFLSQVDNSTDLGRAYVELCGGISEAIPQNELENYFDEEAYKAEADADFMESYREYMDLESIDDIGTEKDTGDYEEYVDEIVSEEIANAAADHNNDFFEAHFDYDKLGRELEMSYTYVDGGAINIL